MPFKLTDSDYKDYLENNKNIFLYFTASWCGPCKRTKPHFENAENTLSSLVPDFDLSFVIIDVDEAPSASTDFSIECMPTFILVKDGLVVDRVMGGMEHDKILALVEKHFSISGKAQSVQKPTLPYSN